MNIEFGLNIETDKYRRELKTAVEAALSVGEVILNEVNNHAATKHGLEFKANVDMIADKKGTKVIRSAYPNDLILTEEQGIPKKFVDSGWICDLLDGTNNFLNSSRMYSVLIGLVKDGEVRVGVSYLPATNSFFMR